MTAKRPRTIGPDTLVYPCEIEELIRVPVQRLMRLWQAGKLPQPALDGRLRLGGFLRAYIEHVERTAREDAAAKAARETRERLTNGLLFGLDS